MIGAVVVLAVGLSGCAGPTITDGGYRAKTAGALRGIASSLATAKLAMQLERDHRMTLALTDTSISQAESDTASALGSWQTRQPPTSVALRLHDRVEQPMQDAGSALEDLRIAYRNSDSSGVDKALGELDKAAKEIDTAIQEAS
ncbi:hypothetical protein [Mycobacterium sp.]|uniref:hypothetical protein n=1 Tax=Mycobacterium sp. TaxID=1785 RepID=UPI0026207F61|nr:hypothetical protein [Mycobacterium sp.]